MKAPTGRNPFYDGCTALELARIFEVPVATVRDAMARVIPSGKRGNVDLFPIKDAASALRPTELDAETVREILKMNHSQLPTQLSKEFWQAETHRQKFMKEDGDLWPTVKVVEYLSDSFKAIRLSLMLLADSVHREEQLSDRQRDLLQTMVDATLNDAANRLQNEFRDRREGSLVATQSSGQDDGSEEL